MILILDTLGFINALALFLQYVAYEKNGRKITCPINGDCTSVVASRYGRSFGVKNELWGMLLYATHGLLFLTSIVYPHPFSSSAIYYLGIFFGLASLRLIAIQIFVLRNYCFWCLVASTINIAIAYYSVF